MTSKQQPLTFLHECNVWFNMVELSKEQDKKNKNKKKIKMLAYPCL